MRKLISLVVAVAMLVVSLSFIALAEGGKLKHTEKVVPVASASTSTVIPVKTVAIASATTPAAVITTAGQIQIDKLLLELKDLKAQDKLIDNQEDALELSYKNGNITLVMYQTQKAALDKANDTLDVREHTIKNELRTLGYYQDKHVAKITPAAIVTTAGQIQIDKLLLELTQLKAQDNQLEIREDALKLAHKNGSIDLAIYQAQKAALELEDNALDTREHAIKKELTALGYHLNKNDNDKENREDAKDQGKDDKHHNNSKDNSISKNDNHDNNNDSQDRNLNDDDNESDHD
ncbi:MAG: hypothetical protein WCI30_07065 [Clostridia bacterium]